MANRFTVGSDRQINYNKKGGGVNPSALIGLTSALASVPLFASSAWSGAQLSVFASSLTCVFGVADDKLFPI